MAKKGCFSGLFLTRFFFLVKFKRNCSKILLFWAKKKFSGPNLVKNLLFWAKRFIWSKIWAKRN